MSRLCDNLMVERLSACASVHWTDEEDARDWWRDSLLRAERYEVTPMIGLLSAEVERNNRLPRPASLRLPSVFCWVEFKAPANENGIDQVGVFFHEQASPESLDGTMQILGYPVASIPGRGCGVGDGNPAILRYRSLSGSAAFETDGGWAIPESWPEIGDCSFRSCLDFLLTAICQLHVSNISSIAVTPPPRVQKKRMRRNRPPLFAYRELVVKVGKKVESLRHLTGSESRAGSPIHRVRAHWKHFTPAKPLFGRLAGAYFYLEHLRGNRENGVIEKDYCMEPVP